MSEIISLAEKIKSSKSQSEDESKAKRYFSINSEPFLSIKEIRFSSVYFAEPCFTAKHSRKSGFLAISEFIAALYPAGEK